MPARSKENAPAGRHLAQGIHESTQHTEDATLASDEAHEALILQLGEQLVAAASTGNRAAALRFQEQMFQAIQSRTPEAVRRIESKIDMAIDASRSTFTAAMPKRAAG